MTVAEARNKGGVGTAGNEVVIRRDAGERARAGTVAGIKTGTEAGAVRTKPRGLSRTGGVPGWLSAVAAALMAALCALSTSLPAGAHDLPDDAVSLPVTAKRTSLAARPSSPTGQWVTVHSYQWGNHYQNAQYKLSPTPNPDGSVHVTVATTLWSTDGTIVKWTSTKTIYDNGVQVAFIGADYRTGTKMEQFAEFDVKGGGAHHITSKETPYGTTTLKVGWDFYVHVPYTITASATSGGSISPSGNVLVDAGGFQAYAMTPAEGHRIRDVKVDGKSVGKVSSYAFANVNAGHAIAAEFEAIPVHAVTFEDGITGEVLKTESVLEGSSATAPDPGCHEGWVFAGWDGDFGKVERDIVVTSQWDRVMLTVRFLDRGGNVIEEQQVAWGDPATPPEAPPVSQWSFSGWDKDFSAVTEALDVCALYDPVISVRVPTRLACAIMADGTVVAPSGYRIENLSPVAVSLCSVAVAGRSGYRAYEFDVLRATGGDVVFCEGGMPPPAAGGGLTIGANAASEELVWSFGPIAGPAAQGLLLDALAGETVLCDVALTFRQAT